MDRINKEDGELSASGESSESIEVKTTQIQSETNGDLKAHEDPVVLLKDQLTQLGTISQRSPEQRDIEFNQLLLLFIQVQQNQLEEWRKTDYSVDQTWFIGSLTNIIYYIQYIYFIYTYIDIYFTHARTHACTHTHTHTNY